MQNSERTPGLIISSLVQFPTRHMFSIVGQNVPGFKEDVVALISRTCDVTLDEANDVRVVERMGGKYLSLQVHATVRAPEVIDMVLNELGKDTRVKMRY